MIYGLYHHPGETIGSIGDVLKKLDLPFREIHLHDGDGLPRNTSDLEGLIIMGGPMNVDEIDKYPFLLQEVNLLEKVIKDKKPVLGICLGAQLIAKALGCNVYPNKTKEVGWHSIALTKEAGVDPILKQAPHQLTVLHWHGDTFDLPSGAIHLARSKKCENQAFRVGENVYGFQFHFEVTPSMVKSWVESKEGQADVKAAGERSEQILLATSAACNALKPVSDRVFAAYFKSSYSSLLPLK